MLETKFYGLIILAIIIVIFYNNMCYKVSIIHKLLSGFWEASSDFCDDAGIDMLCIYFDEETYTNRACYILMKADDNIVINEPTLAKISFNWLDYRNWTSFEDAKYLTIKFQNISEDIEETFPKCQQMRFYPVCGKIVLYYNDTITAVLYKNPVNSELQSIIKENQESDE